VVVRLQYIFVAVVAAALVAGVASCAIAVPAGAASGPPGITWLAAGDSYASGQGLPNRSGPCARASGSSKTWAQVAQADLNAAGGDFSTLELVACTGATTGDFFKGQGANSAEWTKSMGQYDLVTFSFGGDDVGFRKILEECIADLCSDLHVRKRISEVGNAYPSFLKHVADTAVVKGGNVVVMGYPELIEDPTLWPPETGRCQYGLDVERSRLIRGWAGDLNSDIGKAVSSANALPADERNNVTFTFIDPVSGNNGVSSSDPNLFEPASNTRHELCSQGFEWLNGLSFGIHPSPKKALEALSLSTLDPGVTLYAELASQIGPQSSSFHPNQAGNTGMGNLAAEVIGGLKWPGGQTLVPVHVCTTELGGPGQANTQPSSIPARLPLGGLEPMVAYTDDEGISEVLAPAGWNCHAFVGADSTTEINVWPPGAPDPGQSNVTEGLEGFVIPGSNILGQYDLVCASFPAAASQIGQIYGACPITIPPGETDTTLRSDAVGFNDPPGAKGNWDNLSGTYSAKGVVIYDYGAQTANTTSEQAVCLLPAVEHSVCSASLDDFVAHYAHPGTPYPPVATTQPPQAPTGTTGNTGNTGNTGTNTSTFPLSGNSGGTGNTGSSVPPQGNSGSTGNTG